MGELYNYRILRTGANGTGYGYLSSGIEYIPDCTAGKIIVVIDTTSIPATNTHTIQFIEDLEKESWLVELVEVDEADSTTYVKSLIKGIYDLDTLLVRSVVLIGHVPVPYSGNIAPDGHGNHLGAWSADTYYDDMDGAWTDTLVNNTGAAGTRNDNVPGDGKFDQGTFVDLELSVGRIDLSNLTLFSESELELLENYFIKNHNYRKAFFIPRYRALIENNFAGFTEGFGQNGLRNFSALLSPDSTSYIDFDSCKTQSYIWSYGCGGGTFQSASGISSMTDMASDSVQSVFTMLFGSYFGDFDISNNFLRSALASGTILNNIWAGRPHYTFHPMGMGGTIGECFMLSGNNPGLLYFAGSASKGVHISLMGDPTLRMYLTEFDAPSSLMISDIPNGVELSWTAGAIPG